MAAGAGVKWETTLLGPTPQWMVEPSIEVVTKFVHRQLGVRISATDKPVVKLLGQGAFNKVYAITSSRSEVVLRVSLPVDPRHKTLSEVAVLDLVRKNTSVPIPEVLNFDASTGNELGLEWILMSRVPGNSLNKIWDTMDWSTKCGVVEKVADIMAQLFRIRSGQIGSIFWSKDVRRPPQSLSTPKSWPEGFVVDRIVAMPFFWNQRLLQDIPRGPFPSSRKWLESRLRMALNDCNRVLEGQADIDAVEDAKDTRSLISELNRYMLKIFPPSDTEGQFAVHHDDISAENLLVCVHGKIQALVDWECVSCVPLWKACQFPSFLCEGDRHEKPRRELYAKNPDGTPDTLYFEHLMEYEKTLLRPIFLARMAQTEPEWIQIFKSSTTKADFDFAVDNCDNPLLLKRIKKWLSNIAGQKEYQSLRQLAMG